MAHSRLSKVRQREARHDVLTKTVHAPRMSKVSDMETMFGVHTFAEDDAARRRQATQCHNAPVTQEKASGMTIQQRRGVRQQRRIGKRLEHKAKEISSGLTALKASEIAQKALSGDVNEETGTLTRPEPDDTEVKVKAKQLMASLVNSAADRLRTFVTSQAAEIMDRDSERARLKESINAHNKKKDEAMKAKDVATAVREHRQARDASDMLMRLGSKQDDEELLERLTSWVQCVRKNIPAFMSSLNVTVVMPDKRSNDGMGGVRRGTTAKEQPLGMSSWEMAAMAANSKHSSVARNMLMIVDPKACPNCGEEMVYSGSNMMRCDPCNFTSDRNMSLAQDIMDESVSRVHRTEYHSTYHFKSRLMATQGKMPKRVTPTEYKEISRVLWERGVTKHTLTPWILRYTLRDLGLSHLFPAASSIMTVLTGLRTRKLPRHVRAEVDTMVKFLHGRWPAFQKLMDIMIKNSGRRNRRKKKDDSDNRRNRPNTHYCLWLLAEQRGHPEMYEEVLTIFDPDNLTYKDCIARAVFRNLGWDWPSTRDASVSAYLELHKRGREIVLSPPLPGRETPADQVVKVDKTRKRKSSKTEAAKSNKRTRAK